MFSGVIMANRKFKKYASVGILGGIGLSILNSRIRSDAVRHNFLHAEKGSFYSWDHGNVFYQVNGMGDENLLLIHDTNVYSSATEWNRVISLLKDKYTVYTIDLPGCGRSDKPAVTYTNYLYVQLIHSFIRDVIKGRTHIWASGLSCSYAVVCARMYPERISSITMIEPQSLAQMAVVPDNQSLVRRILLSLPLIGESIYHIVNSYKQLSQKLEEKLFFNPFQLNRRLVDTAYEAANAGKGSGRFLMASIEGRTVYLNLQKAFSELKRPVRIVIGGKVPKSRALARQYVKLNPSAEIISIEGAGHLPQIENPRELAGKLQ